MSENEKLPIRTTLPGVAIWPHLNKPDTKWKEAGEYHVQMRMDKDAAAEILEVIVDTMPLAEQKAKGTVAAARKKGKKLTAKPIDPPPYFDAVDEDGNETGEVIFKFKSNASGVSKKTGKPWKRSVPLFDAKGKLSKANIYGGSTLIVSYTAIPWANPKAEYGVKLQIEAVQIIDLVTSGGQRSASAYGFGAREGGYSAENESEDGDTEDDEDPATDDDGETDGVGDDNEDF